MTARIARPVDFQWSSKMGMNEWVLVGTGFVLARVLYLWYIAPKKAEATRRR